jgi:DNA modification methylase
MKPVPQYLTKRYQLYHGRCEKLLKQMPSDCVHSIVTGPPYEYGFMGREWDKSGIAFSTEMWREALRVLKPGGYLLTLGATRTIHRMVCAIEDAGFEIRDRIRYECSPEAKYGSFWNSLSSEQRGSLLEMLNDQVGLGSELAWGYGTGMPKSLNISKAIDKVVGAKRIVTGKAEWDGWGTALAPAHEPICIAHKPFSGTVAANVMKNRTGGMNIDACRIPINHTLDDPRLGGKGTWKTGSMAKNTYGAFAGAVVGSSPKGRFPKNVIHDGSSEVIAAFPTVGMDKSASRFFYCAKTSPKDRNAGCEHLPNGNDHPTVQPTSLMRTLIRLVTPTNGIVLDPFMGSGTTGKAAMLEGVKFAGIEMKSEYFEISRARIKHAYLACES